VQRKRFSGWVGVGKCLSSLQEAEVCLSHPLRGPHIPKSSLCGRVQCYSDLFRASNSG
jgi:hypothetical protein